MFSVSFWSNNSQITSSGIGLEYNEVANIKNSDALMVNAAIKDYCNITKQDWMSVVTLDREFVKSIADKFASNKKMFSKLNNVVKEFDCGKFVYFTAEW